MMPLGTEISTIASPSLFSWDYHVCIPVGIWMQTHLEIFDLCPGDLKI